MTVCADLRSLVLVLVLLSPQGLASPQQETPAPAPSAPAASSDLAQKITTLIDLQKWEEAAALADQAEVSDRDDPDVSFWVGVLRQHQRDLVGAIRAFRAAERMGLQDASLHKRLGLAYYDLQQSYLFRLRMEKAAKADPSDFEPFLLMGVYYESVQADCSTALEYFGQAASLNPKSIRSVYLQGLCLESLGRKAAALQSYERAQVLAKEQGVTVSWPFHGIARIRLSETSGKSLSDALLMAQKAVDIEPEKAENRLILAQALERLEDLAAARLELEEAVRLDPDHQAARYRLFKLYQKLGRSQEARVQFERFEQLKTLYAER